MRFPHTHIIWVIPEWLLFLYHGILNEYFNTQGREGGEGERNNNDEFNTDGDG